MLFLLMDHKNTEQYNKQKLLDSAPRPIFTVQYK